MSLVLDLIDLVAKHKSGELRCPATALIIGHLIFEMAAGYELTKAHPDPGDLYNCRNPGVVEVGIQHCTSTILP